MAKKKKRSKKKLSDSKKSKKKSRTVETSKKKISENKPHSCSGIPIYGAFLLAVGIIWLLDETHLISINFSLWPIVFIITGITFIFHKIKRYC